MGWMMAKAQALGVTFDPAIAAQYGTLPAEFALDAMRESWTAAAGPPKLRPVAPDAKVSNSVAVRLKYALTYVPGSLTIADGALADSYSLATVVGENAF
jgi:hypothetical protein